MASPTMDPLAYHMAMMRAGGGGGGSGSITSPENVMRLAPMIMALGGGGSPAMAQTASLMSQSPNGLMSTPGGSMLNGTYLPFPQDPMFMQGGALYGQSPITLGLGGMTPTPAAARRPSLGGMSRWTP